jgi:hypothetical protein
MIALFLLYFVFFFFLFFFTSKGFTCSRPPTLFSLGPLLHGKRPKLPCALARIRNYIHVDATATDYARSSLSLSLSLSLLPSLFRSPLLPTLLSPASLFSFTAWCSARCNKSARWLIFFRGFRRAPFAGVLMPAAFYPSLRLPLAFSAFAGAEHSLNRTSFRGCWMRNARGTETF